MAGIAELIAARIPKSNSLADALKRRNEAGDYLKSRDDASAMEAAIRSGDDAAVMRLPGGADYMKKVYDARATAENVPLRRAQTGQALAAADRSMAAGEKDMQATKAAKHAEWGNRLYSAAQDPAFNGQIANGFLKEAVDSLGMSYSQAGQLQESLRGASPEKIRAAALQIAKGTLDMTKQQAMGEISATAVAPKVKTVNAGDAQVGVDENPRSPTFGKQLIRTQINTSPDARLRAQTREDGGGYSKPPSGFRFKPDGSLEAIPGGPSDRKDQAKAEASSIAARASLSALDALAAAANELKNARGLRGITGLRGVIPNIPGTDPADAQAKLETLKAKVAFGALQAMRDASKTGGALGNITERELAMLQNSMVPLERAQSYEEFQKALDGIMLFVEESKDRIRSAGSAPDDLAPKQPGGLSPQEQNELDALRKRFGK